MKDIKIVVVIAVALLASAGIGTGLAYSSVLEVSNNSIQSTAIYCTTSVGSVTDVTITGGDTQSDIGFGGDIKDCKITYTNKESLKGILVFEIEGNNISNQGEVLLEIFKGGYSESPSVCIGSTYLVTDGTTYTGAISGIGPIENNGNLTIHGKVSVTGEGATLYTTTLKITITAYPLEA